jgi:hypothetical protein
VSHPSDSSHGQLRSAIATSSIAKNAKTQQNQLIHRQRGQRGQRGQRRLSNPSAGLRDRTFANSEAASPSTAAARFGIASRLLGLSFCTVARLIASRTRIIPLPDRLSPNIHNRYHNIHQQARALIAKPIKKKKSRSPIPKRPSEREANGTLKRVQKAFFDKQRDCLDWWMSGQLYQFCNPAFAPAHVSCATDAISLIGQNKDE